MSPSVGMEQVTGAAAYCPSGGSFGGLPYPSSRSPHWVNSIPADFIDETGDIHACTLAHPFPASLSHSLTPASWNHLIWPLVGEETHTKTLPLPHQFCYVCRQETG